MSFPTLRRLLKSPGATALAVGTLALGLAAILMVVSIYDFIYRASWSFTDMDRVVRIAGRTDERPRSQLPLSRARLEHYRNASEVFVGIAADEPARFNVTGVGDTIEVGGWRVTANYFEVLGVRPLLGRAMRANEQDQADVVMLGEPLWRERFAADPFVLGRSLVMNGVPYEIIGVFPEFPRYYAGDAELWTSRPFGSSAAAREQDAKGVGHLHAVARLRPGVSKAQATAALATLHASYRAAHSALADSAWSPVLISLPDSSVGHLRPIFAPLLGAIACVLLLACSNVANLLLARLMVRQREIAVRRALGAPRAAIVKLILAESLLVSSLAAALGLGLAHLLLHFIPALAPDVFPPDTRIPLNGFIVAATCGLALLTGLATGIYPAWRGLSTDVVNGLKAGTQIVSGTRRESRVLRTLVGAQVALSLLLLGAAALLLASFERIQSQTLGFQPYRVMYGLVNLPKERYADDAARADVTGRILEAVRQQPGVEAATASSDLPLAGSDTVAYSRADGTPLPSDRRPKAPCQSVSPDYFAMLGIPIIAGRAFSAADTAESSPAVIISAKTRERLFGTENPLGQSILLSDPPEVDQRYEVVGVVGDVRSADRTDFNAAEFYLPFAQKPSRMILLSTRMAPGLAGAPALRTALRRVDSELPLIRPRSLDYFVHGSIGKQRLIALLTAGFAWIAFMTAAAGIFGVVSFTVEQRRREIGLRTALGASVGEIIRFILSKGLGPVIAGLAIGLVGMFPVSRLVASQLYETSPTDPILLSLSVVALGTVATLASLIPAHRASRIHPTEALRAE